MNKEKKKKIFVDNMMDCCLSVMNVFLSMQWADNSWKYKIKMLRLNIAWVEKNWMLKKNYNLTR